MESLERIRFVTAHYYDLHGLRWVVWGVVCLFIAAEDAGALSKWLMLGLVLPVGLAGFVGASAFYVRTYGLVKSARGKPSLIMSQVLVLALLLGSLALDKWLNVRPFIQPFAFALWFAASFWWVGRRYRWHYLLIAVGMAAANVILSAVDFPPDSPWLRRGVVTWTLLSVAFFIGGLLDHRLLVRTLRGRPEHV